MIAGSDDFINTMTKKHWLWCLVILAGALALRIADIFVFRLDEHLGELIVSKGLAFLLILLYLHLSHQALAIIGLHKRDIGRDALTGMTITIAIYCLSYLIEYCFLLINHQYPALLFFFEDAKQQVTGGIAFGFFLLIGNVINALAEEGLFRGLLIPVLLVRFSFFKANTIQAVLFGAWHLVWPIKDYLFFDKDMDAVLMMSGFIFLGTTIQGFIWGYLFYKMNSLWVAVFAHFAANTILNIVHITSAAGINQMIVIRSVSASILGLIFLLAIKWLSKKWGITPLSAYRPAAPEQS